MALGQRLAKFVEPPILIELVGDLGGGKTALVKAIALGIGIAQTVTSPTFNIHRSYIAPNGIKLEHFDLYRLSDDEIVLNELLECLEDPNTIVCTEWANHFTELSGIDKLTVECHYVSEDVRDYVFDARGKKPKKVIEDLAG